MSYTQYDDDQSSCSAWALRSTSPEPDRYMEDSYGQYGRSSSSFGYSHATSEANVAPVPVPAPVATPEVIPAPNQEGGNSNRPQP